VRLLLDTHLLVWSVIEPNRLKPAVRQRIEDVANELLFSSASMWEIAIKAALGRADFRVAPEEIHDAVVRAGFTELAVRSNAGLRAAALPPHHRDPFDRLLVAQAEVERATLYTADRQLLAYGPHVELV
jgi:PIN domain nuclease of toxin-antitoxin system